MVDAKQSLASFHEALDALLMNDDDRRYIDANPAACELFGMSHEELVQRYVTARRGVTWSSDLLGLDRIVGHAPEDREG